MTNLQHSPADLEDLAVRILRAHNTSAEAATAVAKALVAAQTDGHVGHGLSRLPAYCAQADSGKVNGHATPTVTEVAPAAVRIDANHGFAYPALDLAVAELAARTSHNAIAVATIHRSHHFGVAGYHVEKLAHHGLLGLLFGNSPKAMAPWGGSQGVFGTNPIAFAAPRLDAPPLVIDLSLSKVARGRVMVAAKNGEPIPSDWALDPDGNPTTDANAALSGTMLPVGDAKGAALALMVEILAAALTGAQFGFEASSFFTAEGRPPGVGQCLMAINPEVLSGQTFAHRLEALLAAIIEQPGTRLPGSRRLDARASAAGHGVTVTKALYDQLLALL